MATIPVGNFGQAVAAPSQAIQRSAGEFGAGSAKALGDLAQTVGGIATQQIAQQTKLDQEVADRDAQTAAARVRITKSNEIADAQDQLGLDVQLGKVPKADADKEWQVRSREILKDATTGIDPRYAGSMQVEFDGLVQRGSIGVRRAVTKRNQDDVQANLLTLGEEYQRAAQRDRAKAQSEYFAQLDVMGPEAGWAPDVIAQKKQQFKEGTAYTEAFGIAKGAQTLVQVRNAQKALASDAFEDISPQKRMELDVFLTGKEGALIQKAEHAANTAARAQEARLNRARAEFESAQGRLMSGIPDNDAQLLQTVQALSGTPYMDTYKTQQNQARTLGGFASKSIPEQQREVDALYAERSKTGGGDQINERIRLAEKALGASKAEAQEDNLRAYVRRTPGESVDPIDLTSPQAFIAGIKKRLSLANRASLWSGKPSSVLMSDEAQQVGVMLSSLPVAQRASALAALGSQLGPQASAGLAAQLGNKDRALELSLRYASANTTAGRYVSEIVQKGQQAIQEKTIKGWDTTEGDIRADIAKVMGDGSGFGSDEARKAVFDSALYIAAGLKSESKYGTGPLGFKGRSGAEHAVELAAGGKVITFNGKNIPIPAGMDDGDFEGRIKSLTPDNFKGQAPDGRVKIGGASVGLSEFVQSLPDAQLVFITGGMYNVLVGKRVVTNSNGTRIIIKAK